MKIENIMNDKDGYAFKIDGRILLEISSSAVPQLGIEFLKSDMAIPVDTYYDKIKSDFDIELLVKDVLFANNDVTKIIIDSIVCSADGSIFCPTKDLIKYSIRK